MKQALIALILGLGSASGAAAESPNTLLASFAKERAALDVRSFALSLEDNLAAVKEGNALAREGAFAARWSEKLRALDPAALPLCDRIDHAKALHEAAMIKRRADLGAAPGFKAAAANGLGASAEGKAFYDLLLDWQLGVDVAPDAIFAFGEDQIRQANVRYDALVTMMGFAGDTAGLADHLRSDNFRESDPAALQSAFEEADAAVIANLGALFQRYETPPVKIARAERGGSLAQTPGFYDGPTGTFYYNVPGDSYDLRNRDWLYLHEATPGHHFQNAIAASAGACKSLMPDLWSPAFVEGWGAYVETLGRDLGLYTSLEAELAAVEWDMVRSARVAIDVGLNHRGWSDADALAFWRKSVRGQDALAQREIDRMRRWPAQVVTYKYGAAMFEAARDRLAGAQGAAFDLKAYHHLALGRGPMPVPVFAALVEDSVRESASRR
jgi:uncharacterized protein (DUF885 family)